MSKSLASKLVRSKVDPFAAAGASASEKAEETAALAKAFNEEAAENWDNPEFHRDVAADVTAALTYGFVNDNPFQGVLQTDNLAEDARPVIREKRGLKIFNVARGGEVEQSNLRDEVWTIPKDTMGFHVSEFEDDVRFDFANQVSDTLTLAQARLKAEQYRRVTSLVQTAIDVSSPYYSTAAGVTKSALDAQIRAVKETVKPDGVLNVPVTIVGRAAMTDQIMDFPGYTENTLDEIMRTGKLGVYKGCGIVELSHFVDEDDVSYFPANELFVLGGQGGRWVNWGGLRGKSWIEDTVDYWHYRATIAIGGLVHHPEQIRRFIDSSVAA